MNDPTFPRTFACQRLVQKVQSLIDFAAFFGGTVVVVVCLCWGLWCLVRCKLTQVLWLRHRQIPSPFSIENNCSQKTGRSDLWVLYALWNTLDPGQKPESSFGGKHTGITLTHRWSQMPQFCGKQSKTQLAELQSSSFRSRQAAVGTKLQSRESVVENCLSSHICS